MTDSLDPEDAPSLSDYVKAPPKDAAFVERCHASAVELVDNLLGSVTITTDGQRELRWQAVLATGANLWGRRRRLTEGSAAMNDGVVVTSPDRPTRDPLDAARHILGDLLGPGIA